MPNAAARATKSGLPNSVPSVRPNRAICFQRMLPSPPSRRTIFTVAVFSRSAVSADGYHAPTRIRKFRGDAPRKGDAHRRQAVRDHHGTRLDRAEEPAEPQLVGADVGDQEIVRREDVAKFPHDALRLQAVLRPR